MKLTHLIQIQGSVQVPIENIINEARSAVSGVCLGIDDMHLLGKKALVIQAEIYPEQLSELYKALTSTGININKSSLPDHNIFKKKAEHRMSLQITSFSGSSDGRINIPKVPG